MVCIGIDESYKDTGIAINKDGKLVKAFSIKPKYKDIKTRYRLQIKNELHDIIESIIRKYKQTDIIIIVERIRQFSGRFISMDYIKAMSALIATIVDEAYGWNHKVYSVDTRNWKANIVGTSKPKKNNLGIDPKKYPTYEWCINNGYEKYVMEKKQLKSIKANNHKYIEIYNDNIGDSIAISFTPWNNNCKIKLKQES